MAKLERFRAYLKRFTTTFVRNLSQFLWQQIVVGFVIAVLILWEQIRRGIVSASAVRTNLIAVLAPYAIIIAGLILWHLTRTAYLLHLEDQSEIERLREFSISSPVERERDPRISAKFLRSHLLARNPIADVTAEVYRSLRLTMPPVSHDVLVKLYIVNLGEQGTTIQRIEAEAEIDGEWRKLKLSSLEPYMLALDTDEKVSQGGLRDILATRQPLDDLWKNIRGVELRRGIGYEGWLAFELEAETDKLSTGRTNFRFSIVDAMDGVHPVLDMGQLEEVGRITHSPQNG